MSSRKGKAPRKISCTGNVCFVPLTKGKVALVDKNKVDLVKDFCWNITSAGYAYNKTNGLLHRYLMQSKKGEIVDHINGDRLDNRLENMRHVTNSQSLRNRKKAGAIWDEQSNRWRSRITVDGKVHHFGSFLTKDAARKMTLKKEKEMFGEHSLLMSRM